MDAIYVSTNSFKVMSDRTSEFVAGRRVKLDCGLDGIKYATVVSSSYSSPYTTVQIDESDLTASLTSVWYAVVSVGSTGSLPDHAHDGSEGSGGTIDAAVNFLELTDTPSTYSGSSGQILSSTGSGIEFIDNLANADIWTDMEEPTGFVNYKTGSTLSYSGAEVTISGTYDYYIKGTKYNKSGADSVTISSPVEGSYYIYYDGETLSYTDTFTLDILSDYVYVAEFYWDDTNNQIIHFGDERHGMIMDNATHVNLHLGEGTRYISGLSLVDMTVDGDGSSDTHAQFGTGSGVILDEDLRHEIDAVSVGSTFTVFYRDGANGYWRKDTQTGFAFLNGAAYPKYNLYSGGVWSQPEVPNGDYVLYHIFATNDIDNPIISVMGQDTYDGNVSARAGANDELNSLILSGLPFAEFVALGTVIIGALSTYTNSVNAIIVSTDDGSDYVDWRTSKLNPIGANITAHGDLSGLSNDDHSQYLLVDGSRSLAGNWNTGSYTISGTGDIHCNDIYTSAGTVYVGDAQISATSGDMLLRNNNVHGTMELRGAGTPLNYPTYIERTTGIYSGVTSFVCNKPSSAQEDDLMICHFAYEYTNGNNIISLVPSGWTLLHSQATGNHTRQLVYYKLVSVSEPSSYTWEFSAGTNLDCIGAISLYRHVDIENPIGNVSLNTGSGNPLRGTSINLVYENELVVHLGHQRYGVDTTPPTDYTEMYDLRNGTGSFNVTTFGFSKPYPSAGATGSVDASASLTNQWVVSLIALRPNVDFEPRTLIDFDPDGKTRFYYAGSVVAETTTTSGLSVVSEVTAQTYYGDGSNLTGLDFYSTAQVDTISGSLQNQIDAITVIDSLLGLSDTPSTYSGTSGQYLMSTGSGTVWSPAPSASGTDDHSHSAYVPWNFGSGTISGTGDIYCNDIFTASGTVYIGDLKLSTDGSSLLVNDALVEAAAPSFLDLTDTPSSFIGTSGKYLISNGTGIEFVSVVSTDVYHGSGVPSIDLGKTNDYYIEVDTNELYKKNYATYGSDLATGGTATASSKLTTYVAANAVDNNTSTRWVPATSAGWHWWQYDFGAGNEQTINKLRMYTDAVGAIEVYGSNDLIEFTLLYSITGGFLTNVWQDFEFLDNTEAHRYIRINITHSVGYIYLKELELLSAATIDWQVVGDLGTTQTYVDNLVSTTSGVLQTQIDNIEPPITTLSGLSDTPDGYGTSGYFLQSTGSGTTWAEAATSGTDDHSHAAYVPWNFGAGTISGTGDIYCNDIYTSSGTVYIGDLKLSTDGSSLLVNDTILSGTNGADGAPGADGSDGADGATWYDGSDTPASGVGAQNDYYLHGSSGDVYKKDAIASYSSDVCTGGTITSENTTNPSNIFDDNTSSYGDVDNSPLGWIGYEFSTAQTIKRFKAKGDGSGFYGSDFRLLVSNTGSFAGEEVTLLDTTFTAAGLWQTFDLTNDTAYKYFRVYNDGFQPWRISEIEMLVAETYDWATTGTNIKGPAGNDAPTTFSGLTDTPPDYGTAGQLLASTGSGIEWSSSNINSVNTDYEALELVAEYNFSSETLDATISGISGNTDDEWYVSFHFTNAGTANAGVFAQFNGDSTSGNYKGTYSSLVNTSFQGAIEADRSEAVLGYSYQTGTTNSTGFANIFLKSGQRRIIQSFDSRNEVSTSQNTNAWFTTSWTNTVDEINSIRFFSASDITGRVKVYKRTNISLPIYEPNYIDTNLYTMELVREWNLTNSGINETIDWNGDTDDYVEFQVMNMEVPPTSNIKLRFNNDTGSNYLYQYTSQDGSAFAANTASSQTYALITNSYNDLESSTTKCFLKNNGQERALYSERVTQRTDNTDSWHIGHTGQIWQNSADKVTSITVYSDNTDITGTLRMYKRVNLQLPVSGIGSTTFSGLSDTPANYGTQGDYLVSTGSGVEYFSRHKAKMTRDAAQTIPNTTNTKVAFDNVVYDEGNITSVSGSKFVITSSGTYSISTKLNMASMSGDVLTYIYINSTAVAGSATINNSTATLTDTFVLDATDEVEFYVYHNYGSDRDTNTTTFKPSMSVVQI